MSSDINDIYGCNYIKWVRSVTCVYNHNTNTYTNAKNWLEDCGKVFVTPEEYTTGILYVGEFFIDRNLRYMLGESDEQYNINYKVHVYGSNPITAQYHNELHYCLNKVGCDSRLFKCSGFDFRNTLNKDYNVNIVFNNYKVPSLISYANFKMIICTDSLEDACFGKDEYGDSGYYYCYCIRFSSLTTLGDPSCNCVAYFNQLI